MILRRIMTKSTIETMTVQRTYVSENQPKADLLNDSGILFEGCSILGLGGEDLDFVIIPEPDQDVLTITEYGDNPYIIGVFSSQEDFRESVSLSGSGEHPTDQHSIQNARLKNKTTQVILTPTKIFHTAPTRIQNTLEISNGNTPGQSLAVAEPLIDDLEDYQTAINQLKARMDLLLTEMNALQGPLAPLALIATSVNALPSFSAPAPDTNIISSLVKTER